MIENIKTRLYTRQDCRRRFGRSSIELDRGGIELGRGRNDLGRGINIHEILISELFYLETAQKCKKSEV